MAFTLNTKIPTNKGMVPINRLDEWCKAYDIEGNLVPITALSRRKRTVYEVITDTFQSVRCTADQMLIATIDGIKQDVTVADLLVMLEENENADIWLSIPPIIKFKHENFVGKEKGIEYNIPNPKGANPYLFGILYQNQMDTTDQDHLIFRIEDYAKRKLKALMDWKARESFGYCTFVDEDGNSITVQSMNDLYGSNSLFDTDCGKRWIAYPCMCGSFSQRFEFIRGVYDSCGNLDEGYISFTLKSKKCANDFANVVRSVGIKAYVTVNEEQEHKVELECPQSVCQALCLGIEDASEKIEDTGLYGFRSVKLVSISRLPDKEFCSEIVVNEKDCKTKDGVGGYVVGDYLIAAM